MKDIWNGLLEFETSDLVSRFFIKKFNREASARKIREITSNFIQGREYFTNANRSNFIVKPLLQYYGVVALSRGLILAYSPLLSESELKPSHGVDVKNWQKAFKDKDFGTLEISITNGTLLELIKATQNKSYHKANSSEINFCFNSETPKVGETFLFKKIIQCLPDLLDEYEIWSNDKFYCAVLKSFRSNDENEGYTFTFEPQVSGETLISLFPLEEFDNQKIIHNNSETVLTYSNSLFPYLSQKWEGWLNVEDIYIVPSIGHKTYLSNLGLIYIVSYVLGMTARYFPSTWVSLSRVEKGDSIYPLVIKMINFIQNTYPKAILEFLKAPYNFEIKE